MLTVVKNKILGNKIYYLKVTITVYVLGVATLVICGLTGFDDVTCYSSSEEDALPAIGDYRPPAKSIFFLETSCRGKLNSRQACGIESAARIHPNWQINVFFVGPVTKLNLASSCMRSLKKYENIKLMRIHLVDFAKGTPLENIMGRGVLNRTKWRISHTSDALRYLSLYKWSGVYLDMDIIVTRSFDELSSNWVARECDAYVAAGAISFSVDTLGRKLAEAALRDFAENYRNDLWAHNGPRLITRLLSKMCSLKKKSYSHSCKGLTVYTPALFYPISYEDAIWYFEDKDIPPDHPFTYHYWNQLTYHHELHGNSLLTKLAKKYCPQVVEDSGHDFGVYPNNET